MLDPDGKWEVDFSPKCFIRFSVFSQVYSQSRHARGSGNVMISSLISSVKCDTTWSLFCPLGNGISQMGHWRPTFTFLGFD